MPSPKSKTKPSIDFFTNLDKVLFPKSGITKGDLALYYEQISDYMLPHIRQRPLSLLRFPSGIQGETFYQKDAPDYTPKWIPTVRIGKDPSGSTHYMLCNDKKTLLYLANQVVVIHPW